ncbi:MAG: DUF3037 domain-containing protein [Verrucomicrobiota bacterium]
MKTAYTYTVLRYVHDTATGEFVNVGVALYAPDANFVSALCRTTYGRLTKVFPGMDGEVFKSLMRYIQSSFEGIGYRTAAELPLGGKAKNVMEIAVTVLPRDDSSLQWSEMGSGLTENPSATLEKIYNRVVQSYDQGQRATGRSEEEVWRKYRRDLEEKHVLSRLVPKTIVSQSKDDEIEFQHAWQNQQWHCIEPVSFDLMEADSIKDKAHRWLGQIASVRDSTEPFKLYMLLGEPQLERLKPAFIKAQNILNKIPGEKEFIRESDSAKFADEVAGQIKKHDAEEAGNPQPQS